LLLLYSEIPIDTIQKKTFFGHKIWVKNDSQISLLSPLGPLRKTYSLEAHKYIRIPF